MAKTRAGIHYGDTFGTVCKILGISGSSLHANGVMSPNTATKLNRRYKGGAGVEATTRESALLYLKARAKENAERADVLSERGLSIDDSILSASFRLSDAACARATGVPIRPAGILKLDRLTMYQVGLFAKGHFGVRKHIEAVARQILSATGNDMELEDMVDEHYGDDNECFPCVYVKLPASKQLELLRKT